MTTKRTTGLRAALVLVGSLPALVHAYGPEGHLIAGIAAEGELCRAARMEVAALGGDRLPELGLWADRIRADPDYRASAPWHYMNIADDAAVRDFRHPPEGDVLEAIQRFERTLADRAQPAGARAEALKFLVHFIVDIHQPLHVGRAADRGGNSIEFSFAGGTTNLHRFWDTDAIDVAELPVGRYARMVRDEMRATAASAAELDPVVWAEESLALRGAVYDFDPRRGVDAAYVNRASAITRRRLAQAALRLAGTLNELFCAASSR